MKNLNIYAIFFVIITTLYTPSKSYGENVLGPIDPGVILIWGPNYKNLELNGVTGLEEEKQFPFNEYHREVPFFFKIKDRPRNYLGFDCDNNQLVYYRHSHPQEAVNESNSNYIALNTSTEECIEILQEALMAKPDRPFAIEQGQKRLHTTVEEKSFLDFLKRKKLLRSYEHIPKEWPIEMRFCTQIIVTMSMQNEKKLILPLF